MLWMKSTSIRQSKWMSRERGKQNQFSVRLDIIEVKYMKQIFKDVLSCKSLRDGLKQAILAIVVAILERTIIALKGGTNNVRYIDV